ncbi:hypothetical protein GpartN1_g5811.t1 [Galdieria partita]|uniref:SUMO-conjugating enzyme UBC9 n=1 Tax=Galdieria partita TaxID=83374 RepID=A0A9C7UT19_9RHOD|nr:hypothetical protein GpartN1_g5811.t1 [Galdieria partita]
MANSLALTRLQEEHRQFRKDHPHGFFARPFDEDGKRNYFRWQCGIPGKKGTEWEGGTFHLILEFSEDYPTKPPICRFNPPLFHPNIFPSGTVCLSLLDPSKDWKPSVTIKSILFAIQELLGSPNLEDPAQAEPYRLMKESPEEYRKTVREIVKKNFTRP